MFVVFIQYATSGEPLRDELSHVVLLGRRTIITTPSQSHIPIKINIVEFKAEAVLRNYPVIFIQ